MPLIKRIAAGVYDVQHDGTTYEIEKTEHGDWQLVELSETARHYWNHFATKRAAIHAIVSNWKG